MAVRSDERQDRMRSMIAEHLRFVARALRRARVPREELDDSIQRTFIVAARRLERTPVECERSFLYSVVQHVASHARRAYARRREIPGETPDRGEFLATPYNLLERKRMRELVDRIIDGMDTRLRAVLILHELEELNLTEISAILAVPRGTVASRLRRARAKFRDRVADLDLAWMDGMPTARRSVEPTLLRAQSMSGLARALLEAGATPVIAVRGRAHTLAALGLRVGRTQHAARCAPK